MLPVATAHHYITPLLDHESLRLVRAGGQHARGIVSAAFMPEMPGCTMRSTHRHEFAQTQRTTRERPRVRCASGGKRCQIGPRIDHGLQKCGPAWCAVRGALKKGIFSYVKTSPW